MDDGDDESGGDNSKGGRFPDAFRKAVVSGISALFVTEENVRNLVSDMRLPKDAMSYVVQQTEKTRREMFRVVAHEVKGFLRNADITGEMRRALIGLKVQVRAEVKFSEDKPDVSLKSRLRRRKRRGGGPSASSSAAAKAPDAPAYDADRAEADVAPADKPSDPSI